MLPQELSFGKLCAEILYAEVTHVVIEVGIWCIVLQM